MAWPLLDQALGWLAHLGYPALFALMFADTAMLLHFVPGLAIVGALLLAVATTPERLAVAFVVMTAGSVLGTSALYAAAAYGGRAFLERHGRLFRVNAARLEKMDELLRKRGAGFMLFALRLVPLLRVYVAIPAGLARVGWRKFLLCSTPGIVVFNAAFFLIVLGVGRLASV